MAAASVAWLPVEAYLGAAYQPDVDYVDGVLETRNVGEFDHARIQRALLMLLAKDERRLGYFVIQELRVQVSPTRFRVPDTCLLPASSLPARIATQPPLLCIEVLSPEDRFAEMRSRCQDYLAMGVPEVWILDPISRSASALRGDTTTEHRSGALIQKELGLEVLLTDIFSILD